MKTRQPVMLRHQLDDELKSYVATAKANAKCRVPPALAIGAIALGSLGITPALNAEIVYTPTNQILGGVSNGFSTLQIDLNNDGIADFFLLAYNLASFSSHAEIFKSTTAAGLDNNEILISGHLAAALVQGQIIGLPQAQFARNGLMARVVLSTYRHSSTGLWRNATNRYLGVKFAINGEIHYGWARMNASAGYAQLTGYAYETIPNKPIPAGLFPTARQQSSATPHSPATLGMLAMGAAR